MSSIGMTPCCKRCWNRCGRERAYIHMQSQTELMQARTQLKASQAECQTLSTQLTQLKETSTKARESFEKSEREHARTEERLRTQKTAWQIVSGSLLLAVIF